MAACVYVYVLKLVSSSRAWEGAPTVGRPGACDTSEQSRGQTSEIEKDIDWTAEREGMSSSA